MVASYLSYGVVTGHQWVEMRELERAAVKKHELAIELRLVADREPTDANKKAYGDANNDVIDAYTDYVCQNYNGIVDAIDMYPEPDLFPFLSDFDLDHAIKIYKAYITAWYHFQEMQDVADAKEAFEKKRDIAFAYISEVPNDIEDTIVKQAEIEHMVDGLTRV